MWKLLFAVCFAAATAITVYGHYPEKTKYNFLYAVNDPVTQDVKNQWERKIGDKVLGSYRLAEADGTMRIVDYFADGKKGFRAIVRCGGQPGHQLTVPVQQNANFIPVKLVPPPVQTANREYYGATFVRERDYGRGLGYL